MRGVDSETIFLMSIAGPSIGFKGIWKHSGIVK